MVGGNQGCRSPDWSIGFVLVRKIEVIPVRCYIKVRNCRNSYTQHSNVNLTISKSIKKHQN